MSLFPVKELDKKIYEEQLRDFLPSRLFDVHTHVCHLDHVSYDISQPSRNVKWPMLIAKHNPIEDLQETYRLMFPGKEVEALIFGEKFLAPEREKANEYVSDAAKRAGWQALYYSVPEQSGEELEQKILAGGFLGIKSYLSFAPDYLPAGEIRILDFFPPHQLAMMDRHGWIVMCHIPRDKRLRDPVNLQQILWIKKHYPSLKLIIAHVGRAYCPEDVGDAFEVLAECPDLLFDFSANCCQPVLEQLIRAVGPKRILFGSDMEVLRMRCRRICENGTYINLVPPGLYGDVSIDPHLREVSEEEAEGLTFLMYEELLAMKRASEACGLTGGDVEDMFYNNGKRLIEAVRNGK